MVIYGEQLYKLTTSDIRKITWPEGVTGINPVETQLIDIQRRMITTSVFVESLVGTDGVGIIIYWYDDNSTLLTSSRSPVVTKGYVSISATPPEKAAKLRVHIYRNTITTETELEYRELKVEYGAKRTPWCKTSLEFLEQDMKKPTIYYGNARIGVDSYWNRGILGQGVKIGIMDDGMSKHEAIPISGGYACGRHTTYLSTTGEHAIHCAGIAMARNLDNGQMTGVAPMASLYAIRMYYRTFEDRVNSLIEAIDYSIEEGIDVLSMSVHISENSTNEADGKGSSKGCPKHMRIPLRDAFIRAYDAGLIVVVAAGNHNDGSRNDNIEFEELLPKMPGAVAVANASYIDTMRLSSGVGKWVDVTGYGSYVWSTGPDDTYRVSTGTSMSTPQIAGLLALYKNLYPDLKHNDIIDKMYNSCELLPGIKGIEQGRGVPKPNRDLMRRDTIVDKGVFRTWHPKTFCWRFADTKYRDGDIWKDMEGVSND